MSHRSRKNQEQASQYDDHLSTSPTPDPTPLDAPPPDTIDPALIEYIRTLESSMKALEARMTTIQSQHSPPKVSPTAIPSTPPIPSRPIAHSPIPPKPTHPNDCLPLIIGSRDGISPDELDLVIGYTPHQLASNLLATLSRWAGYSQHGRFSTPIVLVPVPLFPKAVPHPRRPFVEIRGRTLPNYELGTTNVRESMTSTTILIDGIPTEVSLAGYAAISTNVTAVGKEPVSRHLDRLNSQINFQAYSLIQEGNYSLSHDRPGSESQPAFIPSHQPHQQYSNPSPDTPFHHPHAPPVPTPTSDDDL